MDENQPPTYALIDDPGFSVHVGADEAHARRYADALWAIQEQASRHFGSTAKTLAPRDYKRILGEVYAQAREALGLRA